MNLRPLENVDAPFMLEWMHDENIVKNLQSNFLEKTINDCNKFITDSKKTDNMFNLAIVDDMNEYMGTVSLKHINQKDKSAEFAIVMRKKALGKGYSEYGMREIIKIGFERFGLQKIFWCVSKDNKRAIRFYEKNEYNRIRPKELNIKDYTREQIDSYIWYCKNKYYDNE